MQTPSIKQYRELKGRYPDAVLLFRTGSDYQCYREDAETLSKILGIALIKRDGCKVSYFAYSLLDKYLPKLVRAGHRVAICEQLTQEKKELHPKQLELWQSN